MTVVFDHAHPSPPIMPPIKDQFPQNPQRGPRNQAIGLSSQITADPAFEHAPKTQKPWHVYEDYCICERRTFERLVVYTIQYPGLTDLNFVVTPDQFAIFMHCSEGRYRAIGMIERQSGQFRQFDCKR